MSRRLWTAATLCLAASACHRPAATTAAPTPAPTPALLYNEWRSVTFRTRDLCGERIGCLVSMSARGRPTVVSVRVMPLTFVRTDPTCRLLGLAPGMDDPAASADALLMEVAMHGLPPACRPLAAGTTYETWERGDARNPFEVQNGLGYVFTPAGYSDTDGGRRIRCAVVFDPKAMSEDRPRQTVVEAAEICAALFNSREVG